MPQSTQEIIKERLEQGLSPDFLAVLDESQQHIGHPGALGAGGHFRVRIKAASLQDLGKVQQHRIIYAKLKDLMPQAIHALAIEILTK
jgi:BolA family transcriptional regulator, general stress-responsive regulator